MRFFGLNVTREKAIGQLAGIDDRRGWRALIKEAFTGAWQKNVEVRLDTVLSFHAVFACQSLIASDIAKLRVKLVQQDANSIWSEVKNPAYSPVLRKPNGFQNRIQFFESWVLSKLQAGNTYVLKQRDNRGVVVQMYVLDPNRVRPMVSDDASVFYELKADNLAGIGELVVPAREIIHDRFNCFFHPLVGLSPVFANGLASTQGIAIQNNSAKFFANGSQPGGILTAPGRIDQANADRLRESWEEKFTGANAGRIAVLGDGLKYEAMTTKAVDAQLIEQLKWTSEVVCSTYHVPPYKIGVGPPPTVNNVQSLNIEYYSQCLQVLIEAIELCLDEGLGIGEGVVIGGNTYGTEVDLDNLLRMDSVAAFEVAKAAKGVLTLDETRRRVDVGPIEFGNTLYLQEQDHSLAAIAARDAMLIAQASAPATTPPPANDNTESEAREALIAVMKGLA